jgi:hypothetical protein
MAATASASAALPPVAATGGDLEDSNISSPLSEVDDKDANDEEIEHMHLDRDHLSAGPDEAAGTDNAGSDSDSALSDAASDVNSEANDTEAETLRLYDTPQTQRHHDVGIGRFNDREPFEHTPSKLRRPLVNGDGDSVSGDDSHADDDGDADDDDDGEEDDVDENESPTKPITVTPKEEKSSRGDSHERKRKRSAAAEHQSDLEQPARKRTGSISAADADGDDHLAAAEDDATPAALPVRAVGPAADDDEASATNQDTPAEDEAPEVPRKTKRGGSKRKTVVSDDAESEAPAEARDEQQDPALEEEPEPDHAEEEEAEPEADEETDAAARNLEEGKLFTLPSYARCVPRTFADTETPQWKGSRLPIETGLKLRRCLVFSGIGKPRNSSPASAMRAKCSHLSIRLYKDRLQRLEEEEQSLHAPEPTHPEYLNMKQCLDDRLEQKLRAINTEHDYRLKALERRAVAQRAQIWSQYFQAVREKREHALEALNRQWYDVQSARRSAHSLPDYGLLFPKDPAQRIRNAIAYNTEVSTLAGLAKYEGFPAGPELQGASTSELEADLAAMEVSAPNFLDYNIPRLLTLPLANPTPAAEALDQPHPRGVSAAAPDPS